MAVRQRKRGKSWIAYWKEGGRVKKKSFGPGPEGEAAARLWDSRRLQKNKAIFDPEGGPLVEELARYYFANHQLATNNAKDHLEIRLEANILPFFGGMHAARLTDQNIDGYYDYRQKKGVKNTTVNRELNDLQAILNFAAGRKPPLIPRNPIAGFKKRRCDDAIIVPPDQGETAAIIAAASPHILRFIYMSIFLGARPGYREILTRRWGEVRWHQGLIVVISAHKGGAPVRQVPLHDAFLDILGVWYDIDRGRFGKRLVDDKTIVNYHGRSIRQVGKAWGGTLKRAGINRRIRPYDLRHQFASEMLSRGEDIKTVSEIMGSAPATILKHYQHVSRPQHRRAIAGMGGLLSSPQETS
jgi:integrase